MGFPGLSPFPVFIKSNSDLWFWLWSHIVWEYKTRTRVKPMRTVVSSLDYLHRIFWTERKKKYSSCEKGKAKSCGRWIYVKKTLDTENLRDCPKVFMKNKDFRVSATIDLYFICRYSVWTAQSWALHDGSKQREE